MNRRALCIIVAALIAAPALADIPPQVPQLDRTTQLNASHPIWGDRIYLRWRLNDGRWWCTYTTRAEFRRVFIEQLDDLLAPRTWNAAAWRPLSTMSVMVPGPATLDVFTRSVCNAWLPAP